jgi:hypothetical protein
MDVRQPHHFIFDILEIPITHNKYVVLWCESEFLETNYREQGSECDITFGRHGLLNLWR